MGFVIIKLLEVKEKDMSTKIAQKIRNELRKEFKCGLYNFPYILEISPPYPTTQAFGLRKKGNSELDIYIFFHNNQFHIHSGVTCGVTYETTNPQEAKQLLKQSFLEI
jgi:hypothetical protein